MAFHAVRSRPGISVMQKLRQVPVKHALKNVGDEKETSSSVLHKIGLFEEELKAALSVEVLAAMLPNRIFDCASAPLYEFVRKGAGTALLMGTKSGTPGEDFTKVYDAICQGKLVAPLLNCLDGWSETPSF